MILNLVSLHKPLYIMGTKEKLIERFLTLPKNFTYDEVKRLFGLFGYSEGKKGNTSGSRVEFISADNKSSYIMHKPHPSNIIKGYVMKQLLAYIRENKLIEKYEQSKE
jgi:hypothetical protein